MDSGLITLFLPIALAIVMAGLGLELTLKDFARISKHPKVVFIALFCQLFLLVGIAFLICKILALPPLLAVGLMLLAASLEEQLQTYLAIYIRVTLRSILV